MLGTRFVVISFVVYREHSESNRVWSIMSIVRVMGCGLL